MMHNRVSVVSAVVSLFLTAELLGSIGFVLFSVLSFPALDRIVVIMEQPFTAQFNRQVRSTALLTSPATSACYH